jgi:hypothetical protein
MRILILTVLLTVFSCGQSRVIIDTPAGSDTTNIKPDTVYIPVIIIQADTMAIETAIEGRDLFWTSKVDSVDLFWKDLMILTNKEIQDAIESWAKRRGINLYD